MSKKRDRVMKIINLLKESNGCSVKELAQVFQVSEMTIRRDLRELEKKRIVENYYGSSVYNQKEDNPLNNYADVDINYNISQNAGLMVYEKNKIGKRAVELVQEGDIVIIDNGTTTEKLTQNLPSDINFTAVVYSANNLLHLLGKPNVDVVMPGGVFHRDTGMFESEEALSLVNNIRATKVFLSAAGVNERLGVTCAFPYEVQLKKHAIENSLEVILLADSTKFEKVLPSFICSLPRVSKIITDNGIDLKWIKILADLNIELIIV